MASKLFFLAAALTFQIMSDRRESVINREGKYWTVRTVLSVAAVVFRESGNEWISENDAAAAGVESSAARVIGYLMDTDRPLPEVLPRDVRKARKSLEWIKGVPDRPNSSNYEKGLYDAYTDLERWGGKVPLALVGKIATTIVAAHDGVKKHRLKDAWSVIKNSRHVNEFAPGVFQVVRAKDATRDITLPNGRVKRVAETLLILADQHGNGYKAFVSGILPLREGDKIDVTSARIKSHVTSKDGIPLTWISHVRIRK